MNKIKEWFEKRLGENWLLIVGAGAVLILFFVGMIYNGIQQKKELRAKVEDCEANGGMLQYSTIIGKYNCIKVERIK